MDTAVSLSNNINYNNKTKYPSIYLGNLFVERERRENVL
jgi:hypothetical protein